MSEPKYKVRPSSRTDPKDVFRVFLSPAQLLLHKLRAGDVCNIETPHGLVRPALVWPSTEKIKDDVVQTSKPLQILYGLKLDNRVSITRSDLIVLEARDIILSEDGQDESEHPISSLDERGRTCWAWLLEYILSEAEILAPGMVFDRLEAKGERRSFRIISINYINASALFHASPDCKIHIINQLSESLQTRKPETRSTTISSDGVGGLDRQLKQLNERMATYLEARRSRDRFVMPSYYRPRRGGVLLHGSSGTGKSMLLNKISEAGWRNVLRIDKMTISHRAGEIEAVIHQVFSEALRSQPSVILIDGLDFIAGKNSAEQLGRVTGVGQILCNELGRIVNTHTLVVGATRKLSDIEQDLRLSGRFEFEIEIPIPDSKSRAEILKVLSGFLKHEAHTVLDSLAARTHAFVGADLQRLLERAVEIAAEEAETQFLTGRSSGESSESCLGEGGKILIEASEQDFDKALLEIRPTAMQEIFVETPNVCWDDIGGQGEVKKRLEQAIVWPFKYPNEMKRYGLRPKKGLLLYGPPGCSKTMIARAAATESGLNFIAVRGAELLSMYVGESERAVREVFSKARAASPSIIFFDEIDAVGARRDNGQQGGIHTVTTLLNELDGFEELKGVFVLAATNKPEILDPALIRAGRLSETLYVGLPDVEARRDILKLQMPSMNLTDEVDGAALSEVTQGYSGAEIVEICEQARYAALEEQIYSKERQRISQKHFDTALAKVERSITHDMTSRYEAWGARRH